MPSGNTTTDALNDSLDTVLASARTVREYEGVMPQLVDGVTLEKGTGLQWREAGLEKLIAGTVTESTTLDNPQQFVDTLTAITPTIAAIHTIITDRTANRLSKVAYAKLGGLAQSALQRKKDADGLVVLDGATTSLGGAGTTLTTGILSSASYRISSNTTEAGPDPKRIVLHGFQIKDIFDELAPTGTYPVGEGMTARVFSEGFRGMIAGAQVYEDGNLTIDSLDDTKGGVFSQIGIILVQGHAPRVETRRRPDIGGGATELFMYDEFAYGERSAGNWLYEIYTDALAPTS